MAQRAEAEGVATAVLSLDDLYLTRAERDMLAREVHPLLRTRGVPGTHDVALGLATIGALERGEPTQLPRFDKGRDDRARESDWPSAPANTRLLIFEGWCMGAIPEPEEALVEPVNALERNEDPDGTWRRYANTTLAGPYRPLFERLDLLILLAAPGFEVVRDWRIEQERSLRDAGAPAAMDDAQITRFIQLYERLTCHILRDMPGRADLVAWLDWDRSVKRIDGG